MKRIFLLFVFMFFLTTNVNANPITSFIKKSDFESNSTVSVFVKDLKTDNIIYKKNEKKLLNPASTLKILTFGAAYKILEKDYNFETKVFKDSNNNLFLRLAGDPLFKTSDLNELFSLVKEKIDITKINNIYIDDTIIDKTPYPNGWMQEDVWPFQRMITPYIIDNNFSEISIKRSSLATKVEILQNDEYKIPIINELKLGDVQKYEIKRAYGEDSNIVSFSGTIKQDEIIKLPVLNPEINFVIKLNKVLNKNDYNYFKKIQFLKTPQNAIEIAKVGHGINEVSKNILHNSDNFASETVSKVAAAKYINYSKPASNEDMISMFYSVFANIITDDIKITDSSGVSRSNLLNTVFLADAFSYLQDNTDIITLMPTSTQGTLSNRLLFLKDNLKAKTGTLSSMSSIIGTLATKKQNSLLFIVIVQNSPKRKAILKNFEDNIITILFRSY